MSELRKRLMASFDKVEPSAEKRVQIVNCVMSALAASPGTQGVAMRIAEGLMAQNMLDVSCTVAAPVIADALHQSGQGAPAREPYAEKMCGKCGKWKDVCICAPAANQPDEQEYNRVMSLLRNTKMPHGLCEPRSRKACTHCNAVEKLDKLIDGYKGARIILAAPAANQPDEPEAGEVELDEKTILLWLGDYSSGFAGTMPALEYIAQFTRDCGTMREFIITHIAAIRRDALEEAEKSFIEAYQCGMLVKGWNPDEAVVRGIEAIRALKDKQPAADKAEAKEKG